MDLKKWQQDILQRNNQSSKQSTPALSTKDHIQKIIKLQKAMSEQDKSKLLDSHKTDQMKDFSNEYHSVNSSIDPDFHQITHGSGISNSLPTSGLSPKTIHQTNNNTFMVKPYYHMHQRYPTHVAPGWGAMVVKNLYQEGGLGHMVEDINSHEVAGVPVTVHKFNQDHKVVTGNFPKKTKTPDLPIDKTIPQKSEEITPTQKYNIKVNPLHARQIGMMDYLVGNIDRHAGNIMASHSPKDGKHDLFAIDHDRVFMYPTHDSPFDSYTNSAMHMSLGDDAALKSNPEADSQLAGWWSNNKAKIYSEMIKNLKDVKNTPMRRYLLDNFDQRFNQISDWADNYSSNYKSFFKHDPKKIIESDSLSKQNDEDLKRFVNYLPKDISTAMNIVAEKAKSQRTYDELQFLNNAMTHLMSKMSPHDFASFISKRDEHPAIKQMKNNMLDEMFINKDKHKGHINALHGILSGNSLNYKPFLVEELKKWS